MGTIWVREFTGGLDTRRLPETTAGGVLIEAVDCHINRGGEVEKRAAFVPTLTLPAGTVGLAQTPAALVVFGSGTTPGGLPSGVQYQRLQHPSGTPQLSRILSTDLYAGKLYVVGEYNDGSVLHFYDGVRVEDWFDGRARASFDVIDGVATAAVPATGSFEITGGTDDPANQITEILINGVNLLSSAVTHTGDNTSTAAAVATAINGFSSSPDYTAENTGPVVTITAVTPGTAPNGQPIVRTVTGDFTTSGTAVMGGGAAAVGSQMTDIQVNGVSIINAPVVWAGSAEDTAQAISAAINGDTSVPEYTATSIGPRVNIVAQTPGTGPNNYLVAFTTENGLVVSPALGLRLANGAASTNSYQPGSFVKTIGQKMYSVSGPTLHFSGIKEPTQWTTDAVGAGFIDMSQEVSGTEELVAVDEYQNYIAIFADRVTLIWYVDPDPALNRKVQVLKNTGTISPRSVTQFGDNDIFYLDESGLRSLRARDSSNAAATNDTGVLIDTLITDKLAGLNVDERRNIIGIIEPRDGRFWLAAGDVIYVFSFFPGVKVSAWSTYTPTYEVDGDNVPFEVEDMIVFQRRVYVRSGNQIFVYGGTGASLQYDATEAQIGLPALDANQPTKLKDWTGLDAAVRGQWKTTLAMQITDQAVEDEGPQFWETSYNQPRIGAIGRSSHISPRFRSLGSGPAILSSIVVHYEGDGDED